jgi:hypothetical protein
MYNQRKKVQCLTTLLSRIHILQWYRGCRHPKYTSGLANYRNRENQLRAKRQEQDGHQCEPLSLHAAYVTLLEVNSDT